jgi:hypothetical protein
MKWQDCQRSLKVRVLWRDRTQVEEGGHARVPFARNAQWQAFNDLDGSGKKAAVLMAVLDNQVQIAHTDFWLM